MIRYLGVWLIIGVAVGKVPGAEPKAPDYDGKPLSQWLKILGDKDHPRRTEAVVAMQHFGPAARAAVPFLIDMVKEQTQGSNRPLAIWALSRIGPDAKAAVPVLVPLLQEREPGTDVCFALLHIGAAEADERLAVRILLMRDSKCGGSVLLQQSWVYARELLEQRGGRLTLHLASMLSDQNAETRVRAAQGLTLIGPKAEAAVPALRSTLAHDDKHLRCLAAVALAKIDARENARSVDFVLKAPSTKFSPAHYLATLGPDAVPHLVPRLADEQAPTRATVTEALSLIGEAALPGVVQGLSNESAAVRAAAAQYLGRYTQNFKDPSHLIALRGALQDGERAVRLCAAESLVRSPAETEAVFPVLTAVLADGAPEQRQRSAAALEMLGARGKAAAPHLRRALDDATPAVRLQAALALAAVDPTTADPAVPTLTAAVQAQGPSAAPAAAALGRIGPAARPAVPTLRDALKSKDAKCCVAAARAVVALAPDTMEEAVAALAGLLQQDYLSRQRALRALADIGAPAKALVPVLEPALLTEDKELDLDVAAALVRADPSRAKKVVELLGMRSAWNEAPAENLAEIGKLVPAEMVPALAARVKDASIEVSQRRQALHALAQMGSVAKAAVPELIEVARGMQPTLKRAATQALLKIDPAAAAKAGIQ